MSDTTTTVAAEPSEQPAVTRPRSPIRRALVWIAVIGVVAAGSLALAASDLDPTPARGGAAARYVPADGTASLVTAADGTRAVHENARGTGPGMLLELPGAASAHFFGDYSDEALRTAQLWRETVTPIDTDDPQTSTIYLLDDSGISVLTATGGSLGFSYTPALVLLPADAAPGVSWTGAGDALPLGLMRYTISGSIAAGEGACLAVTTDTRYVDPDTGEQLLAVAETATWCPGEGVVDDAGTVNGDAVGYRSGELPATEGPVAAPAVIAPATRDLTTADAWTSRALALQLDDAVYGVSAITTPFDGLAAARADGGFIAAVGSRVVGFSEADGVVTRRWAASPGGDLLRLSTAGDVSLASTAQRRLVAYDARGARMWAVAFPDVVLAEPAVVDGDLVVASLDGTLRRIRIDTGATVWSVALRTDIAAAPVVVDGAAVVVDRGGNVIARDVETGTARWSTELVSAERIAADAGVLAVQGTNADVWVLDPADGSARWTDHHAGIGRALAVRDGVVVSLGSEGAVAWDVRTGTRRWDDPATEALLPGRGGFVLIGATIFAVRSADGREVLRVPIDSAPIGTTRMYLDGPDGVRVLQSDTSGFEVTG